MIITKFFNILKIFIGMILVIDTYLINYSNVIHRYFYFIYFTIICVLIVFIRNIIMIITVEVIKISLIIKKIK